MKRKSMAIVMAVCMLVGSLAGCGSNSTGTAASETTVSAPATTAENAAENETEEVTIKLWHRWSAGTEEALMTLIDEFETAYPNIHVEVTAKSGEYFALLQSMIADAAAGNDLPDVFIGGYNLLNYIATELNPTNIDELAPSEEELNQLYAMFQDGTLQLAQYDGEQVGLPFAVSIMPMYINMDLFKQAGLTEEDVPTTWDEVFNVADVIQKNTGAIGVQIHNMEDAWGDQALVFSRGGQLLTEDKQRCDFTNEGCVEAISMWQDLYTKGYASPLSSSEIQSTFTSGNLAIYCTSIMSVNTIVDYSDFEVKLYKTPSFEGYNLALPSGGAAFISFSQETEKKNAVWTFLNYASGKGMKKWAENSGYLSPTDIDIERNEYMEVAYDCLSYSVVWECWPGGSVGMEIDRLWITTRNEILWEGADVKSTLAELEENCNMMLENQ